MSFKNEADDLLTHICDFISQAVLKCRLTQGSRTAALAQLGFQLNRQNRVNVLNPNRVIGFFGILLLLMMCNFILFSPRGKNIEEMLLKVTMIVTIYACAVICSVFPKEKWTFFKRGAEGHLPLAGYLVSGIFAALFSMLISIGFKTMIFCKGDPGLALAAQSAWNSFASRSYPFVLMAFSTAALIGFQIDLKLPRAWPNWLGRMTNGSIQAFGTLIAALLVYAWLGSIRSPQDMPPQSLLLQTAIVIGFVVGIIVPGWYTHRSGKGMGEIWPAAEKELPVSLART